MNTTNLVDCHIHSVYSDGKNSLEDNIKTALNRGIETIALTDHWGMPEFVDCSINGKELPSYFSSIEILRDRFPQIEIISGLEADWYPGCAENLNHIKNRFATQYDNERLFLLGSVHYLKEKPLDWDKDVRIWEELGANELWHLYVDQWCKAATSHLFDSMAHPDLPKVLRYLGYEPSIDLAPLYREMAQAAKEGGIHVEINTAGPTKQYTDFYPERPLLEEFFAVGVPLTVGSDSHTKERIGENIIGAYDYARSVGYTSIDAPTQKGWRTIALE